MKAVAADLLKVSEALEPAADRGDGAGGQSGDVFKVRVFADETGTLWVGVHFGSRGLGHRTATGFLNLAAGREWDARSAGDWPEGSSS